jgi:hypothetical protein
MFENRLLRRIFGPKVEEVTGKWRKLQKVGLHNFWYSFAKYYQGDQIKKGEVGKEWER